MKRSIKSNVFLYLVVKLVVLLHRENYCIARLLRGNEDTEKFFKECEKSILKIQEYVKDIDRLER